MPADTFSAILGLLEQGTGNNNNTWGILLNTGVMDKVDQAVAGRLTSTVTGGTLDLSINAPPAGPSGAIYAVLNFVGTLTADQTVKVPNLTKIWLVENNTSGAFVLLFQTPSGTAVQIPQGAVKMVRCDGSNGMRRFDQDEIGRMEDYALATVPAGMLACDGTAYKRTRFPDLFAKIGTTWGLGTGGDGTTFGVPNCTDTGRFKRSSSGSLTVGTSQANQNAAHTHTGQATGTTGGQSADHSHQQQGTFASGTESALHSHTLNLFSIGGGAGTNAAGSNGGTLFGTETSSTESASHTHNTTISGGTTGTSNDHTHSFTSAVFTTSSTGGSEARPENVVVLSCIRY